MRVLIHGGQLIDPASGWEGETLDLLIIDGKVDSIGRNIGRSNDMMIIDARGLIVTPGLIDMHVHLREPGYVHKETIRTGTRSAAKGGFTSVVAMANTDPPADSPQVIEDVISRSRSEGAVNVFPVGSVTLGLRGEELVDVAGLVRAGVVALSDDGKPVKDPQIMRQALIRCKELHIPIISHCEEVNPSFAGWVMNKGVVSSRIGVIGLPNSAEELMVERDIKLAEETSAHLHIAHVSTAGSIELIRRAKKRGVNVTAEVTPHHFTLTDSAIEKYGANAKMNPPLRSKEDVHAVIAGLCDGTIDVIATDHAPHTRSEKAQGLESAPFGIVGLETCLPLVITQLVYEGHISLASAIAKMTVNPARILNLNKGMLSKGADADITIIDINKEKVVDVSKFESMGRNTPFAGWKLKGWPVMTIVGGRVVMKDDRD